MHMRQTIDFSIEHGNITEFTADVVALKYAQDFYGADRAVAEALSKKGIPIGEMRPLIGDTSFVNTHRAIKAPYALFVGVPQLRYFGYPEIRELTARTLLMLRGMSPTPRHLATTIHGANFGLDEVESLLAQFAVCLTAARIGALPETLERITIVDIHRKRVEHLRAALEQNLADAAHAIRLPSGWGYRLAVDHHASTPTVEELKHTTANTALAGAKSEAKQHIFVAMPFSDDMVDVFNYGIQQPVRAAGFLCGRIDYQAFVGDIFQQIRTQIDTAAIVIADLTGANPNVYLEVGYAWGQNIPTILLVKDVKELKFDVQGQKCLVYRNITHLEELLAKELAELIAKKVVKQ